MPFDLECLLSSNVPLFRQHLHLRNFLAFLRFWYVVNFSKSDIRNLKISTFFWMIHIQSDFSAESNELYFVKYDFDLFRRYSGFPGLGTISTK